MSAEHPMILYVGDIERGRALLAAAEARGGYAYLPADTMEALAMVVTYFPDAVIIDPSPRCVFALEVYMHLRSFSGEAAPILMLDQPARWEAMDGVTCCSPDASAAELVATVQAMLDPADARYPL
jgi:DNA-binding response OmpR family regulator